MGRGRQALLCLSCLEYLLPQEQEDGLGFVDPADALTMLMAKWLIVACELGDSNFKIMLRFHLSNYQPYPSGKQGPSYQWFLLCNHIVKNGSTIWNHTTRSYRQLIHEETLLLPRSIEEWVNSSFWWTPGFNSISPCFSQIQVAGLAKQGLQFIKDAWIPGAQCFISTKVASAKFGLLPQEFGTQESLCLHLTLIDSCLLIQSSTHLLGKEQVGMFIPPSDTILTGCMGLQPQVLTVLTSAEMYNVLPSSRILIHILQSESLTVSCFMNKVRINTITRNLEWTKILLRLVLGPRMHAMEQYQTVFGIYDEYGQGVPS